MEDLTWKVDRFLTFQIVVLLTILQVTLRVILFPVLWEVLTLLVVFFPMKWKMMGCLLNQCQVLQMRIL